MNRREFLFTASSLLLVYEDEEELKSKVHEFAGSISDKFQKIREITLLKEDSFSLIYNLFERDLGINIGTASIRFDKNKKEMGLGLDEFTFLANIYLFFKGDGISDLDDLEYMLKFDENFLWKEYHENIIKKGRNPKSANPRSYILENSVVRMINLKGDGIQNFKSEDEQLIHNPLSAAFEILNGNKLTNFEMAANSKYSRDIIINYRDEGDFVILESSFDQPIIGAFKKVYAILYNNIPLSGYIKDEGKNENGEAEEMYIMGELENIKINGKKLF